MSKGVGYMVLAALFFSAMSVLVKLAGQRLPSQELVLARGLVTLVLSWVALRRLGIGPWGNDKRLLLLRGLAGFGGLSCFYYGVTHLPLADATVIQYTNPILTALLAAAFIQERISGREVAAAVVALLGVVLVARPSFLFGEGASALDPLAVAVAVGGSVCSAIAYVIVRRLAGTEHPLVVVFYFPLVAVPATLPTVATSLVWPKGIEWLLLLGIGVTTQIAQVYMTRGLYLERAGRATAVTYLQVVLAYVWGAAVFAESPSALGLAGAVVVLACVLWVSRSPVPAPSRGR